MTMRPSGDWLRVSRFGWFSWLELEPRQRTGLRVLQFFIGAMYLFKTATQWPAALYLWGPTGLGAGPDIALHPPLFGPVVGRWLEDAFSTDAGTYAILALIGAAGCGLMLGRLTHFWIILLIVTSSTLDARLPPLPDGGDNIAQLVLIYLLFTLAPGKTVPRGSLRIWLHNVAVVAIALQTAIVYFIAGLSKAQGEMWVHGVALYYISQVAIFSTPWMVDLFRHPFIVTITTYAILFWELLFPIAVASRWRLTWIVIGLLFEWGVGWCMGLITFSLVMTGLLLFLLTDEEYRAMTAQVKDARFRR